MICGDVKPLTSKYLMKLISTWLFDPWLEGKSSGWKYTVDMLAAMRATAALAKQRHSDITIYTNSRSAAWLRQILPGIELVVSHDDAHRSVPEEFYSWCKLWTWRLQTEEFLHIDLDFLLGPEWKMPAESTVLMGQWWEDVRDSRAKGFYNWSDSTNLSLPSDLAVFDPAAPALNTGCFMCRDLGFVRNYVDIVEKLVEHNRNNALQLTVPTLEQHTLGMMIHRQNLPCEVLIAPDQQYLPINNQFIHFLGQRWKNRELPLAASVLKQVLDSWIDPELMALARRLDSRRSP